MRPSHFFAGETNSTARPTELPRFAPAAPMVFFAGGDATTCEAFAAVARDMGWRARELSSAKALMSEPEVAVPSCLVLDLSVPAHADIQLHESLAAERATTTVVCITGVPDVQVAVRIMKAGAVDVLPKPVQPELLVDAVRQALARSETKLRETMASRWLHQNYASLSPREREVMTLVSSGLMNKQVSGKLGISEITVKAHRGRAMRKMNARSFADLVKMADKLNIAGSNAAY